MPKLKKKTLSRPPLPPPSLREQLGVPPDVTDAELADLMRPPLNEQPLPQYTFGSQNIGPTAIRVGSGIGGGGLQGVGGPLGALGSMASTALGEDLAQKAEIYQGIRESPDLGRVGIAALTGAVPFPALRGATPLVREAGQAAFNTALPVGMVAAENIAEGRPQNVEELATAGGLGLLMHGGMRGTSAAFGALAPQRARVQVEPLPLEQALGPDSGAAVWHGTQHTWPPEPGYPIGRPKLEYVRTGTGGMSQGHGTYVAQGRKVGEYYRDLSEDMDIYIDGQKVEPTTVYNQYVNPEEGTKVSPFDDVIYSLMLDAPKLYKRMGINYGMTDKEAAISGARSLLHQKIKANLSRPEFSPEQKAHWIEMRKVLDELADKKIEFKPAGNLYALDLPDEYVGKMLDWDKPLSEQSKEVQQAIRPEVGIVEDPKRGLKVQYGSESYYARTPEDAEEFLNSLSGEQIYKGLSGKLGSDEAASAYLLSKGIPGNKYLDASSRGPDISQVESNLNKARQQLTEWEQSTYGSDVKDPMVRNLQRDIVGYERMLKAEKGRERSYNLVLFDPSIATPIARNDQPVPLSVLTGRESVLAPVLPPDVRPIGTFGNYGDQYNLRLPDGTEATFTVEPGGDFKKALADARKRYAKSGGTP